MQEHSITPQGTVYLLHFDTPLWHARHYCGWAKDVYTRLADHEIGQGAKILRACNQRGISYQIVRTWQGSRALERQMKNSHDLARYCPVCKQQAILDKLLSLHIYPTPVDLLFPESEMNHDLH